MPSPANAPFAAIEFIVWAVPALALFMPIDARWVEIALLLSLIKLARFIPALGLVMTVMRKEARALFGGFLAMSVLLVLASGFMFAAEHDAQPTVFSSIPSTMWWAIVTMASKLGVPAPINARITELVMLAEAAGAGSPRLTPAQVAGQEA